MYPENKCQFFRNNNAAIRCETFKCTRIAEHFIGRPDGPRNLVMCLCEECKNSLIYSLAEEDIEGLRKIIDDYERGKKIEQEKQEGKQYPCKYCGEVYYSPQRLAVHARTCEAKKEAEKVGNSS